MLGSERGGGVAGVSEWKGLPGSRRAELTRAVVERDGWVCRLCGQPISRYPLATRDKLTVDHIVPESLGGRSVLSNLRPAHWGCNAARGARVARRVVVQDSLAECLSHS